MNNLSATEADVSQRDTILKVAWVLGIGASAYALYYECVWGWYALHNHETISFLNWLLTSLGILCPWNFGLICLLELRDAAKAGKVDCAQALKICIWIEMAVGCGYWIFASQVQRLTALGALR